MVRICEWCGKEFEPPKFVGPRQRFCSRNCREKAFNFRHHEKRLVMWASYRERHREEIRRKARERYRRQCRIKENQMYPLLHQEFPDVIFLDELTPDAYVPSRRIFCEVKLATTKKFMEYNLRSKYFSGLFFKAPGRRIRPIDETIEKYPKPLLVIVFDLLSGKELARRFFECSPDII